MPIFDVSLFVLALCMVYVHNLQPIIKSTQNNLMYRVVTHESIYVSFFE
jgi:hypothetical protein